VRSSAPLQLMIFLVASWLGRQQGEAIEYLRAENRLAAGRSSDAAQQSVDALYPWLFANSSAESPLARHSRMRSTHLASVSFVMHSNLVPNRTDRKTASSCSGYPPASLLARFARPDTAPSALMGCLPRKDD
jgi:hypothetical protein